MTLNEFLIKTGVNIKDNTSFQGNNLDAELTKKGITINFDKDIDDVTDIELLEIGRVLILNENKGKPFWSNELVDMMKKIVQKHK